MLPLLSKGSMCLCLCRYKWTCFQSDWPAFGKFQRGFAFLLFSECWMRLFRTDTLNHHCTFHLLFSYVLFAPSAGLASAPFPLVHVSLLMQHNGPLEQHVLPLLQSMLTSVNSASSENCARSMKCVSSVFTLLTWKILWKHCQQEHQPQRPHLL